MKDRIRAILKEWLQVKDAVIFTDDIAIEAVTEEIDDAILEIYGTLPSELLKQNEELGEENKRLKAQIAEDNSFPGRPNPRDVNPYDIGSIKRAIN